MKAMKKQLTTIFSMMLIMAMVLVFTGCKANPEAAEEQTTSADVVTEETTEVSEEVTEESTEDVTDEVSDDAADVVTEEAEVDDAGSDKLVVVGEGETQFVFEIVDSEGNTTKMAVNTDKTTVGEALVDCGLIEGEDSEYGLYVKTVNGITADYDVDQTYWAFYVDGEYASTGVDQTDITAGSTYSFKAEK